MQIVEIGNKLDINANVVINHFHSHAKKTKNKFQFFGLGPIYIHLLLSPLTILHVFDIFSLKIILHIRILGFC